MSTKPDQIDLNADAVWVDRENEAHSPVICVPVAETLTESVDDDDQGQLQDSVVDKVRACDSTEVICDLNVSGDDVNMSSECDEGKGDVLTVHIGVQKGNGNLDRGLNANVGEVICDLNVGGDDVNMNSEDIGREGNFFDKVTDLETKTEALNSVVDANIEKTVGRFGNDFSTCNENEVVAAQVADRSSGDVDMDQEMNVGLVREELEQGTNATMNSSSFDEDTSQATPHKSKASSDDSENKAMEMDTHMETSEIQLVDIHVSEVGTASDAFNELCMVNLVVDLNSHRTTDGKVSGNVNTGLVSTKSEFCASDLVWGKVRSHPWWPGQIFDPSAASHKATKYFKKDSYLIAYFGDQTFAYNEFSKIKHFREHFAQMEKQSSLEDFHCAVDCALEEVSRRVEYGLACDCIPEEAFEKIKTQIIVNAGIREELSTRDGGDRFSNAVCFDPVELCRTIKALAQLPHSGGVDRLEFVTVKAQMSAFYCWKGYLRMPEFNMLGGLLESDAEIPISGEAEHSAEVTQDATPDLKHDEQVSPGTGKLKSQHGTSHKRKHTSVDDINPSKKEKTLLELLAERHRSMSNGKGDKLNSTPSGKKRKVVFSISDDFAVKHKNMDSDSDDVTVKHKKLDCISDVVTVKNMESDMLAMEHGRIDLSLRAANKCVPIKKTFGVGSSILKVASQMNGTNSLLKSGDGTTQKTANKIKIKEKSLSKISQSKKHCSAVESSSEELLSQLCLAAQDPMKGYNFLISLISFLSEFRNSVCLVKQSLEEVYGDETQKTLTKLEATETSELELINDSYWTDRVVESTTEEQQSLENKSEAGGVLHENPSQVDIPPAEPHATVQSSADLESGPQTVGENLELEEVKPVDSSVGSHHEDPCPTALVLNFTDLDSVPSKENLNKIFGRFGPLNELETEVMKTKRAKVVFKRRADAETAFSSAGKYSIFGPSLVSYCLKYMSSGLGKASSNATKHSRKATKSVEGNAT